MSLNIENLRVSLQKKKILHGIDLEIQEGEFEMCIRDRYLDMEFLEKMDGL